MPATYAHYRFGCQMLGTMPADMCRTAKRFRRLYDVGLHGPDLFFFYRPGIPAKLRVLGHKFHIQTGREIYSRVCRSLRMEPSEAAQAYLYGVLCHYALDAACHPYVEEQAREGLVTHTRIETEFDAFLFELDGKRTSAQRDLSRHIRLTPGECETVARFYPGTEGRQIASCVKSMATIRKLLALPEGDPRKLVSGVMSAASQEFSQMISGPVPDVRCEEMMQPLRQRYDRAANRFPQMLMQLGAHLTYNAPLGEDFNPIFG